MWKWKLTLKSINMKWIVYQTINVKNNKIYIGVHQTINPDVFDSYIGCGVKINNPSSYMNPTTPFQKAVKKYGTSAFKRSVLFVFDNAKAAYKKEEEIVTLDFIKRKDVYNAQTGGICGYKLNPINQFDLNGNYVKTWNTIVEAAEFYCVSDTAIRNARTFKTSCKKFYWSETSIINVAEYQNNIGQTCYKYDAQTGKYLDTYNTLTDAANSNNQRLMVIERAVKGGYKVKGFYYSTELNEEYFGKPKISIKNKEIYVYTLDGDFVTSLKNGKEICDYFNIKSTSSLTTAIRTGRQYKNYQISLEKKEKLDPMINKRNIAKPVGRYSLTGDLLETYESATQARNVYGSGVTRVLKGQQQHCHNFIFRWL